MSLPSRVPADRQTEIDQELAQLIDRYPTLTPQERAAIMAALEAFPDRTVGPEWPLPSPARLVVPSRLPSQTSEG